MPTILDGRAVADRIGSTYADVMALAREGQIPSIRQGRRVLFNFDRVLDALQEQPPHPGPAIQDSPQFATSDARRA